MYASEINICMKYNTANKVKELKDLKESKRTREEKRTGRSEGGMAGRNGVVIF